MEDSSLCYQDIFDFPKFFFPKYTSGPGIIIKWDISKITNKLP